jgi:hypothetical protein
MDIHQVVSNSVVILVLVAVAAAALDVVVDSVV